MQITDVEYDKLVKRLEFNDTMRNNLLTFSFTAVLAILGIALEIELDIVSSWICLLPYLLIVPFSARISYYHLSNAHIGAFLRTYASDRVIFEIEAKNVKEEMGIGRMYPIIAFLVNHEMVLLGTASSLVFYLKYIPCMDDGKWWHYIGAAAPILLLLAVFFLAHSTNDYGKMVDDFMTEWKKNAQIDNK